MAHRDIRTYTYNIEASSKLSRELETVFSVVTIPSRGPEAEVETTVAGVRFDLGPGVGREGLSLRDPAAGLVDYSHWLTALRYIEGCLRG